MVQKTDWVWLGYPGHFMGASKCVFHLTTIIGRYVVSTVGDYRPRGSDDAEEIGSGRTYETMVFELERYCSCGCGAVIHNGREVDFAGYNDPKAAAAGHMEICEKWSQR